MAKNQGRTSRQRAKGNRPRALIRHDPPLSSQRSRRPHCPKKRCRFNKCLTKERLFKDCLSNNKKISHFLPRSTGLCVRLVLGLPNPYIPRHPTSHRKIATRGALLQPSRLSTGRPQSTATCPRRADSAKRATSLQPKTFRATVATRIAADSGLTTLAPRLGYTGPI
jgi:hypothetical protein